MAKSSQGHQQESQDSKAPQLSALRKTRLQVKADQKQFLMEKTIETNKQTMATPRARSSANGGRLLLHIASFFQ